MLSPQLSPRSKHSTKEWARSRSLHRSKLVKKNTYNMIVVREEDGVYSGKCVEYPAAITQGDTLEELRENMKDAITLVQKSYRDDAVKMVKDKVIKGRLMTVAS